MTGHLTSLQTLTGTLILLFTLPAHICFAQMLTPALSQFASEYQQNQAQVSSIINTLQDVSTTPRPNPDNPELKPTDEANATDDPDAEFNKNETKWDAKDSQKNRHYQRLSNIEQKFNNPAVPAILKLNPFVFKDKYTIPTPDILSPESTDYLKQFGYAIFDTTPQQPSLSTLPVSDTYILGPGDEVVIHLWGKIEQKLRVVLDKQGSIQLPKVGRISLAGATYKDVRLLIKKAYEKKYVNFDCSVTLGQLRTIKVYILGDVKNPGAYNIISASTLFTALHQAGGPTKTGSLRRIKLIRDTNATQTVDLYHYLLQGNHKQDPLLKNNDTIFVPPIGDLVIIEGSVKRPGIFETNGKTSLYQAIYSFAGGFWGEANKLSLSVKGINDANTYIQRDILSTDTTVLNTLKSTYLNTNDHIRINPLIDRPTGVVRIIGTIERPGIYEYRPQMSLQALIEKAEGLKNNSATGNIKVFRYVSDTEKKLRFVSLENAATFQLKEWDIVQVDALFPGLVSIQGAVYTTGNFTLFKDMTLLDAIKLAVPQPNAGDTIEVYRSNSHTQETLYRLSLKALYKNADTPLNIPLQKQDVITLRKNPNLQPPKTISITGEVLLPGVYIIQENESIQSIINRAGGFTNDAFKKGIILKRHSVKTQEEEGINQFILEEQKRLMLDEDLFAYAKQKNQSIDLLSKKIKESKGRVIISNPKGKLSLSSIKAEHQDTLHIPIKPSVITVLGGVQAERGFLFEPHKSPLHYIKQAGGFTQFANKRTILVFNPDGRIKRNAKEIMIGDIIYVPEKIQKKNGIFSKINQNLQLFVNTLSSILLIQNINQ